METKYVAPYILKAEYVCRHCGKLPPSISNWSPMSFDAPFENLFKVFEKLRKAWGREIRITSGYRCPEHNRAVGGSYLSVHLFGLALDLSFPTNQAFLDFYEIINKTAGFLRIGRYDDMKLIHVDVGYLIYPKATNDWVRGMRWNG